MEEKSVKRLTDETFFQEIEKGITVVDFYAVWCGPCRMQAPIMEQLAEHFAGKVSVAKVDIDGEVKVSSQFQIASVPTMIVFKNGKEIHRAVGLRDFDTLVKLVEGFL